MPVVVSDQVGSLSTRSNYMSSAVTEMFKQTVENHALTGPYAWNYSTTYLCTWLCLKTRYHHPQLICMLLLWTGHDLQLLDRLCCHQTVQSPVCTSLNVCVNYQWSWVGLLVIFEVAQIEIYLLCTVCTSDFVVLWNDRTSILQHRLGLCKLLWSYFSSMFNYRCLLLPDATWMPI